jgi:DNA-binding CsgD family transcriptional regulator
MSHEPTVSEDIEFDGFPRLLPEQNAVLVGRIVDETNSSGSVAYYIHSRGDILLGEYENREFMPVSVVDCESRLMSACVRAFTTTGAEIELSSVGKALLQAWHFGDHTPLSHKQAHVYALREKAEFGRDETAAILNISPSTVDTHFQRAREKLTAAENLLQFVRTDPEELADAHPDFFEEAGIGDETHQPDDLTSRS